jgi:hypothetical protein
MSSVALFWLLQAFSLITCLFAFVKGATAERLGAGIILINLVLSTLLETRLPHSMVQISQLTLDALTALSLLVLTIRFASVWLGLVMLLYAAQFALHAFYLVMELQRDMFHFVANNVCFTSINVVLLVATVVNWRRQRTAAASRG